jgi:uncharacterized protein (TIGR03435 family)
MTKSFVNNAAMAQRIGFATGLIVLTVCAAFGQQSSARFEVASVKRAEGGSPPGDIPRNMDTSPGHFAMRNVPLRYCLEWAYSLQDYEIVGPDWIKGEERYDIFAKAPGPASDEEMRPMLQALLIERFQMKVHRETKEVPAYVLLPGKGPAKVKESATDSQPGLAQGNNGGTLFRHFAITRLTFLLTRRMDHPVLDQTGLKGIYDYTVELSGLSEFSGPPNPDPNGISIFAAIQQDLGLKLELRKQQPIDLFVIDSVSKAPTEN